MKFRYREMVYRPDFYDFNTEDCTECYRAGIYNYNISRMNADIDEYIRISSDPYFLKYGIFMQTVSVAETIAQMCYGSDDLQDEHIEAADLDRPILLIEVSPGMYDVADGHHRLEKARCYGVELLDAYIIPAHAAVRYLGSEEEYRDYVKYWNSKVEDRQKDTCFRGNCPLVASTFRERDLSADCLWYQIVTCLNECRRVEICKDQEEWFTLFRLNNKLYCGEAEAHASVKCAMPFAITIDTISRAAEYFEDWYRNDVTESVLREQRKTIRKKVRHADILMACIRVFSEY